MTNYSNLIKDRLIKQGDFSQTQINDCLKIASRDLITAENIVEKSPEWAFNIAYNAMQQAGRAFMFSEGYRTVGVGHHATVIVFLEIALNKEFEDTLILMDRMRRKRNHATYDTIDSISTTEAKHAYINAKQFVDKISGLLSLDTMVVVDQNQTQ